MKLLDDERQEGHRKKEPAESILEFLYRSDRPEVPKVCELLEEWYGAYPPPEREVLRKRLSSHKDDEFDSAFLELYLFTLLGKLGFDVEVPKTTQKAERTEDFRVFRGEQLSFRLEAAYVRQQAPHARQDALRQYIEHALDEVDCENVRVHIETEGVFEGHPSGRRVRGGFEKWYGEHREEILQALAAYRPMDSLPHFEIQEAGANIIVTPFWLKAADTQSTGAVGASSVGVRYMQTDEKLRRTLKRKASRYGTMDVPFVISCALHDPPDEIDIHNALFGDEKFTIPYDSRGSLGKPIPSREPNGLWIGPQGVRNTRVSAVLIVADLFPWSVAQQEPILYHNPWAEHSLPADWVDLTQMLPNNQTHKYEKHRGRPLHEVLGLPQDWPRGGVA
ncbi:MAG TPA: hypothetical protein VMZ31_14470 [Phycisphaerae bacterium]|nr:hypothetical protein [Phycisphaerae bacterium]